MRPFARLIACLTLACGLMPAANADTAQAIATSDSYSCLLNNAGGVRCWGNNGSGQLGDGTTTQRKTPVQVSGLASGITAITTAGMHACALTNAGGVQCWGRNDAGQLGDGTTTQRKTPVQVSGLASGVTAITAGGNHTCAVTIGGAVKCWGKNNHGQLGDGTTANRTTPVAVSGLTSGITTITAGGVPTFIGGSGYSCAVTTTGAVKCWGYNGSGQLGDGTTTNRTTPVAVSGLSSGVTSIAAGSSHTCALTSAGAVKCWGSNGTGQLGDNTTSQRNTPVQVSGLTSGVAAIDAGAPGHTCALTDAGAVQCWGSNSNGQLGDGTTTNRTTPVTVNSRTDGFTAIATGNYHTCAITSAGSAMCWGKNDLGQLGDNTTTDRYIPVGVVGFDDLDGDGSFGSTDAFPSNPAAATDTDHDGKPDSWNAGCDAACQAGSGLVLDDDDDDDGIPDGIDPLLSWVPLAVDGSYRGSSARESAGSE